MKLRSKLSIVLITLCTAPWVAAQNATPESKGESAAQPSTTPQPRQPVRMPLTAVPETPFRILSPDRVRLSPAVSSGLVVKKVEPEYPAKARDERIQGPVVMHVVISKDGNIETLDLVSGHPMLASAAIDAVKQWKCKPSLLNGHPMEVDTEVTVNFTLDSMNGAGNEAPSEAASATSAGDAPVHPADQTGNGIGGVISSTPATPQGATPQRVRVSQNVSNALIVRRVSPRYPSRAEDGRIQGTVLMHAIISKTGDIASLELISGHPLLAPAAIEAVKHWKYKPYLLNGNPVEVDTQIQVNFTLSGN